MITKQELVKALYLSCVENYFLAWMNRYYDVTNLYGANFVSLGQLFDDFSHGATYENYCTIPRLQDVAEEYGIVKHEYRRCNVREAMRLLSALPEDVLGLVRVNSNFFIGYKRASWREDHYICMNGALQWINQYPLSEGQYTEEQFSIVYDGAISLYRMADTNVRPPDILTEAVRRQDFSEIRLPGRVSSLESAIGVLRITRKRMAAYFSKSDGLYALLQTEIKYLDEIYFKLRMKQIKERHAQDKGLLIEEVLRETREPFAKVVAAEKKVAEVIKNGG